MFTFHLKEILSLKQEAGPRVANMQRESVNLHVLIKPNQCAPCRSFFKRFDEISRDHYVAIFTLWILQ